MELSALSAVSPVDGRYRSKTAPLSIYFSEFGLIRYRVLVEVEYFIALCEQGLPQLAGFPAARIPDLQEVYIMFSEDDALRIKELERTTNHDVKAVEYFLREKWDRMGLADFKEFIHFGLTSQDINNTSIPLSLKEGVHAVILPALESVFGQVAAFAENWKDIPMLARTHGQPASPTRLGKEFAVFAERLNKQISELQYREWFGKFGGATGNFNAHNVAYPGYDWIAFGNRFLHEKLGLRRNQYTTQIDHYDDLASLFDNLRRTNVILIDLCRDIWTYISMEYFRQKVVKNEVGSSAMPHKVNPIDFENAEGNLGIANAILDHLSNKLPVSRLQRDLTDSTVLRNVGVPLAHTLIALESILKGFGKLLLNPEKLNEDLRHNWAVVAEAIQTVLRREGYPNPYDALKQFSRGRNQLGEADFAEFIHSLDVPGHIKDELSYITPYNYTGV